MKKINRETLKKRIIPLSLICVLGIGGILAEISRTVSVTSNLSIDTVDIQLDQLMLDGNEEKEFSFEETLDPGKTVSMIPRISNKGVDCFIRAEVSIESDTSSDEYDMTLEHLVDVGENWKYIDGYYYYTDILKEDSSTDLYKGLQLPSEWDSGAEMSRYDLTITVDAVQSKNVTPDFESSDPWHGVAVEKTIRSREDRR